MEAEQWSSETSEAVRNGLRNVQRSAESLASQVAEQINTEETSDQSTDEVPPQGWQKDARSSEEDESAASLQAELESLLQLLASLRNLLPDELNSQLAQAVHQLLLVVRTTIDWMIEYFDGSSTSDRPVEDIPID